MKTTWILVADSARARLFETDADAAALTELQCFSNPDARAGGRGLATHRLPTVNESAGPTRHAIEPHTTPREKIADRFARELAVALEAGRTGNRFQRLVIAAPPRFLGMLYKHFDKPLRACVAGELRRDVTELAPAQLRSRLASRLLQAA